MALKTPVMPAPDDNGLPTSEDANTIAGIEGNAAIDNSPAPVAVEPVIPAESPQAAEPAPVVPVEPVVAPIPTDPLVDATMIMGQNVDLINQIQTLLPPELPQNLQTPANSAEPQPGNDGQKSVFQFDEEITNNVLENPAEFAEHIAQIVSEHVAQEAPAMIQQHLQSSDAEAQQYQEVANTFYGQNPELVGHEQTVKAVAQQLTQRFPAITPPQLLAYTAQMVKGHIQQSNVVDTPLLPQTVTPLNPAANPGSVNGGPQLTEEQAEFDATLAFAQNNSISL